MQEPQKKLYTVWYHVGRMWAEGSEGYILAEARTKKEAEIIFDSQFEDNPSVHWLQTDEGDTSLARPI